MLRKLEIEGTLFTLIILVGYVKLDYIQPINCELPEPSISLHFLIEQVFAIGSTNTYLILTAVNQHLNQCWFIAVTDVFVLINQDFQISNQKNRKFEQPVGVILILDAKAADVTYLWCSVWAYHDSITVK